MDFAVVFLVLAASMWTAWRRRAGPAIFLFFPVGMMLTVALYLHHATQTLALSF
jgi:hypothetical protein